MTPRQALVAHLEEWHPRGLRRDHVPTNRSMAWLVTWHMRQHHRYATNHTHAGPNLGPDQRPPGWYTGADPVPKDTA